MRSRGGLTRWKVFSRSEEFHFKMRYWLTAQCKLDAWS